MPGDSDSKTEKASPKKRRDERKKGNVFQSKDVITVVSILVMFIALRIWVPLMYTYMKRFMAEMISYGATYGDISVRLCIDILKRCLVAFFFSALPILLTSCIVGIFASGIQTRFIVSFESMKPKFSNMSILKGIQRMFSMRSFVELIKSMIKITVIGIVLYLDFSKIVTKFVTTMSTDLMSTIIFIFSCILDMVVKIVIAFATLSFFDYLYQWWDYEKKLRMSKQDQKEEYKHMEGDPLIKAKIKERQRKMAMQRMMQAVPTADVVIRNPTHFAIALRYDVEKDDAPIIVAKGQDKVALRIIELAQANGIPTTLNPPLARALYKVVEPNTPIPYTFYAVIAEIMAWVYALKQDKNTPPPKYADDFDFGA